MTQPAEPGSAGMTGLEGPWTGAGFLATGTCALRYAECGSGPAVILLPKLGGWIADWRHVAASLAAAHRVIAIDPPGHGGSHMAGSPAYLQTVPESAAAVVAGLDSIGIDRFAIAGNSLGGCIAIAIAALWPDLVTRLVLVGVSLAGRMSLSDIAATDTNQPPDAFAADGTPLPRSAVSLSRFGPISEEVRAENNLSRAACGAWLRPSERGVGRMGMQEYLPRLSQPVLLLNGSDSFYRKYATVAERLIPRVQVVTIPGAGPFPHQDHPQITAGHMAAFLAC
jgi:pimeloyl-ACP methyl ester carboxylesterase